MMFFLKKSSQFHRDRSMYLDSFLISVPHKDLFFNKRCYVFKSDATLAPKCASKLKYNLLYFKV